MARADDEHRPVLQLRQVAVVVGVELGDGPIELARELGRVWPLEDARGDHDVVGLEAPVAGARDVAAVLLRQCLDRRAAADRELEARRVCLEVIAHLVLRRVAVRGAGNGIPGSPSRNAGE